MVLTNRWSDRGRLALLFAVFPSLEILSPAHASPQATFRASYDAALDADRATGDPKGDVLGKPMLVPGKAGTAIRVGKDMGEVAYAIPGNFNLQRGTIEMWVKPVDWKPGDQTFCTLFKTTGFHLYKYPGASLLFYMITEGAPNGAAAWLEINGWDLSKWYHLCFVWDGGNMRVYENGVFKVSASGVLPKTIAPRFSIGTGPAGFGGSAQTDIDEVYIYDHPLTDTEISRAYLRLGMLDTGVYSPPGIDVPQVDLSPKVDGLLDDLAWQWAAGITAFVDLDQATLAASQPTVLLVYDQTRLYIAWRVPISRSGAKSMPSLDLYAAGKEGAILRISVNATGQIKATRLVDGKASALTIEQLEGAAKMAGGEWRGELALPLLSSARETESIPLAIRTDGGIIPGQIKGKLAVNIVVSPDGREKCAWACAPSLTDAKEYGTLDLVSRKPAVRLLPPRWEDERVLVGVELRGYGALPDAQFTVEQKAVARTDFKLTHPVGTLVGPHRREVWTECPLGNPDAVALDVRLTTNDKDAGEHTAFHAVLPASFLKSLDCELEYYRFDELLKVVLRPARDELLTEGFEGIATLTGQDSKPALTVKLPLTKEGTYSGTANISKLKPGEYEILGKLADASGRTLATVRKHWTCEQDGWQWAKQLGVTDEVLPPWTPVLVSQGADGQGSRGKGTSARSSVHPVTRSPAHPVTVSCWGRRYDLTAGLPLGVTSQQQELLSAPVTLTASIGGKQVNLCSAPATIQSRGKAAVEVRSRNKQGALDVDLTGTLEYDGLIRYRITLTPRASQELADLTLTIPLQTKLTTLLNYTPLVWDKPPVHEGEGSFAHGLPIKEGVVWSAGFVPFVWLGDEDVGLSWMMEDDRAFEVGDKEAAVQVARQGNRTNLRIIFNGKPRTLKSPVTIDFALQPTPARPLPNDWRSWRWIDPTWQVSGAGYYNPEQKWFNVGVYWWTLWTDIIGWPVPRDPEALRDYAHYSRARNVELLTYMTSGGLPVECPEGKKYEDQWCSLPKQSGDMMVKACPRSDYQHFTVWNCDYMLRHGDVSGVYIDLAGPLPCSNQAHGCGYKRGNEVRPSLPIFAARRIYQRMRALFLQHKKPPLIVMSSRAKWPHYFYADSACSGEQFYHPINTEKKLYHQVASLDQWRAEFLSAQSGIVSIFLPAWREQEKLYNPEATRRMLALTLAHDLDVWPIWCNPMAVVETWQAKQRFGMSPEVVFHPYWREQQLVTTGAPDALIGVYTKPGSVLAIVSSMKNEDREVELRVDLEKLHLPDNARAIDAVSGEAIPMQNGTLKIALGAEKFRMIVLR